MAAIGEVSQRNRVLKATVVTLQCLSPKGSGEVKMVLHIWFLAPESSTGNHQSLALEDVWACHCVSGQGMSLGPHG